MFTFIVVLLVFCSMVHLHILILPIVLIKFANSCMLTTISHWQAIKRILRYFGGTLDHDLLFCKPANLLLQGFADADWASDLDDRKSTSSFYVYFGGNLITWSSKK